MIGFGNYLGLVQPLALGLAFVLTGCVGTPPPLPPGTAPSADGTIRVGETITVRFSDLPPTTPEIAPYEDKVKEDGTITLYMYQVFKAAGKTPLQLQNEIHDTYVPKLYKRLTVTVKAEDRYYTVYGEVKMPSQYKYFGPTKVTQAIATAGGFTDFGRKGGVKLIRPGAKTKTVDCNKAIEDQSVDLEVFPGDTIYVPRRGL